MVAMCVCVFFVCFFLPLQQQLELRGLIAKTVAVAIGVCERWHVTCGMWHVTSDMWHVICQTWYVTLEQFILFFFSFFLLLVLVLLFPHIKRLAVSGSSGLKLATSRSNIWYGIIQNISELDIGLKPSFNVTMTFTNCYC